MKHLPDGTLRRMIDEPLSLSDKSRRHYESCPVCRERLAAIQRDAELVAGALAGTDGTSDPERTLVLVREKIRAEGLHPRGAWSTRLRAGLALRRRQLTPAVAAIGAAAALVGAVAFTPAGSLAQSFITIFQPTRITAVPLSAGELRTLPRLDKFGTMHIDRTVKTQSVAGPAAAAAASGMRVLTPSSLPSGIPSTVTYSVVPSTTSTFTFSAAKAQREAAREGKTLPPMPAKMNGSTLQLTTGAAVAATYGAKGNMPNLIVGQMKVPVVSSTGASVSEMEHYVLSLPGVSPQLKRDIEAIGDPASTLPIPIPVARANAQSVQVQGVHGLAVGDNTGVGSGVIWVKDGIIYGVAGPLPESEVLAIAGSLH